MHLSSFSRLRKYALGLITAPFLVLALAFPAVAQNGTNPQNPPADAAPSLQAKPNTPAEPKSEGAAAGQQSKPEATAAAQPETPPPPKPEDWAKHEAAAADFQAGSKILINIDKS